jgi:hypothetical protein
VLTAASRAMATRTFTHWAFGHYLNVAHPDFVRDGASPVAEPDQHPALAA